jgi:hypothetical protein
MSLRAVVALGLVTVACSSGDQPARMDASGVADGAVDGAGADARASGGDTGTLDARDGVAVSPDGGDVAGTDGAARSDGALDAPSSDGPPDASCPPLQATGYQISDTSTGLTWSRFANPPATYGDATTSCASAGARLPTEAELSTFASTAYGAIALCPADLSLPWPSDGEPMWTTTPDVSNSNFHLTVYYTGLTTSHPMDDGVSYICVKP